MKRDIEISATRDIEKDKVIELYRANAWSAAEKPETLYQALKHSHTLITAWDGEKLVGLGNAISDGYLVVYYPHLLVYPDYQGQGIGTKIFSRIQERYKNCHMQILVADGRAIAFYEKLGFVRAGRTQPLWIYAGNEH